MKCFKTKKTLPRKKWIGEMKNVHIKRKLQRDLRTYFMIDQENIVNSESLA